MQILPIYLLFQEYNLFLIYIISVTLRMMAEYHDYEESFIKMALETVDYDEANFKRLVNRYKETNMR